MRDQFNLSGDFRGANVSIQSKLDHARLTTNAIPAAPADLQDLGRLVDTLKAQLAALGTSHIEGAVAVAELTERLLSNATSPAPDKALMNRLAEGLRAGAKSVGESGPGVMTTVEKVIEIVLRIVS